MRALTGRSFYTGGATSQEPMSTASNQFNGLSSDPEVKRLLKVMIAKMDARPREVKGKWVISESEEKQE
jgi:hypothetical protein